MSKTDKKDIGVQDKIGTLYPPRSMFLRQSVGTATGDEEGCSYELSLNMGGMCPIVRSVKTGKYFTLGWEEIMSLAQAKGIDIVEDLNGSEKSEQC